MTRFLAAYEVEGTTLWSTTTWIDLSVDNWMNDFNVDNWRYECIGGKLVKTRFERGLKTASPWFCEISMLIAGFTLWYVWKARCLKVFQGLVRPPEELIIDIWFTIISCLRGQLDEVCGHSNDVVTAYLRFWQKWRNMPMVTQGGNGPRWNYHPPR
mgnify:CR=1 FL=1